MVVFPNRLDINKHMINLKLGNQSTYGPIFSLGSIKLETLKTYIEAYLANGFIQPFNFLIEAHIFFVQKYNKSFYLYVNYRSLYNLIIKNRYSLLLIGKSLD